MLRIEHLSKAYGEKKAVDDLNLHIAPGEIYGFIGHNGAGKTTTLKSVAGILQFDQGEIYVDGKSIRTQPLECKRTFAYIPDNPDLYDYMTGIKYLNFVADIFGVSAADRQDRIRQYAGLFELTEDLAQPIAAYSHGMKQKLAIISAWLHRPRLILMDEPFVGLDPKASHLLKGMMRQVCDEGGAIFFSTHVLEVAEKLCDKVAIMYAGQVVEYAEVSKIYHNPCHPYTKGLFNSIPKLDTEEDWLEEIHGLPPEPTERIDGCSFNPRCPNCMEICKHKKPEITVVNGEHYTRCFLYEKQEEVNKDE